MAASRVDNPLLGPFAADTILPFNAEPVIVYDLFLRNQRYESVGLDTLAEIRSLVQISDSSATNNDIHWRACCLVRKGAKSLNEDGSIPPLSVHGTRLVKGIAKSRGLELEATFVVTIQGKASQYHWDSGFTPPSILLHTFNAHRGRQVFRVLSLDTLTLQESRRAVQSLSLLTWLRNDNANNADRNFESIIERYRRQFPRDRAYQEPDRKRKVTPRRPACIRGAFITPISLQNTRKIIGAERLIASEDFARIKRHMCELLELQMAHKEGAMPSNQPEATPPHDMEARTSTGNTIQIDEYLDRIPLHFFAHFDLPTSGSTWKCDIEGCHQTYQTSSNEVHLGTDEYDREALQWRQRISRHRMEHLDQPYRDRNAQSAGDAILDLYRLEEESSL